jgi:hypothetical protein
VQAHAHPKADDCFDILSNLQQRGDFARLSDISSAHTTDANSREEMQGMIGSSVVSVAAYLRERNHVRPLSTEMRGDASISSPDWNRARPLPCPGQARPRRQRPPMPFAQEIEIQNLIFFKMIF